MGKLLITIGLCIFTLGVIIYIFGDRLGWFGNLYGDIKILRSNYKFYFPVTSMIVISIFLTIILNILSRFFK